MAFTINIDQVRSKISSTLMVTATDDLFPNKPTDVLVYVGGVVSKILYFSTQVITIQVPKGIDSGNQSVVVYRFDTDSSNTNSVTVEIFYDNEVFSDTELTEYATRFVPKSLGTISVYARDLAYTNYSEITDANCVVQNVLSIILTRKGERLFNSSFGTRILDLLFSSVESPSLLERTLINEIKTQVSIYEPRATILDDISFVEFDETTNALFVVLYIRVPGGSVKELGVTLSAVSKDTVNS